MPLPVIDDNNFQNFITPPSGQSRGYQGMWAEGCQAPRPFAESGITLIPESEWADRIRQKERDRTRLMDLARDMGLPCKNQKSTNYCWVFAPTHCCELIRLKETGRVVSYSPASAGAPIKSFRNNGGWGSQALEYFKANGLNYTEHWPDTAISRDYYTTENRELAKRNVVLEYFNLESWAEVVSCILAGHPVGCGYNWWSHEVTGYDLTQSGNLIIRNSWSMNWGEDGFGELSGSKKIPNDAVAITSMVAL